MKGCLFALACVGTVLPASPGIADEESYPVRWNLVEGRCLTYEVQKNFESSLRDRRYEESLRIVFEVCMERIYQGRFAIVRIQLHELEVFVRRNEESVRVRVPCEEEPEAQEPALAEAFRAFATHPFRARLATDGTLPGFMELRFLNEQGIDPEAGKRAKEMLEEVFRFLFDICPRDCVGEGDAWEKRYAQRVEGVFEGKTELQGVVRLGFQKARRLEGREVCAVELQTTLGVPDLVPKPDDASGSDSSSSGSAGGAGAGRGGRKDTDEERSRDEKQESAGTLKFDVQEGRLLSMQLDSAIRVKEQSARAKILFEFEATLKESKDSDD